jgi:hypothetical protein
MARSQPLADFWHPTGVRVRPAQVDRAIDVYRMISLQAMEGVDGFCMPA